LTISEQRGHRTPRKDIDIVLEASAIKDHQRRQAGDSSRQSHDIEEQETGVDLASKLPQIVHIVNNAKAPRTAYSTALIPPRGTTFCSTLSPGFHQRAPDISL
jgi:hypothetical protein